MEVDMAEIIEDYVDAHTDDLSDLLEDLLAETESITGLSRWSIGKVEGKMLQMLIKISNAKSVVEVGTFTGFSALVMAEALPPDGILTTCENSKQYADIAQRYGIHHLGRFAANYRHHFGELPSETLAGR